MNTLEKLNNVQTSAIATLFELETVDYMSHDTVTLHERSSPQEECHDSCSIVQDQVQCDQLLEWRFYIMDLRKRTYILNLRAPKSLHQSVPQFLPGFGGKRQNEITLTNQRRCNATFEK